MKQRLFFILLFVVGVLIGGYYFSDFMRRNPSVTLQLSASTFFIIALAIGFQLFAHYIRADKSRLLLDKIRPASRAALFRGLSVGLLFNTLLPLRLGELVRAYYVGDELAISKSTVFMSIVIERIVDGYILGLSALAAAFVIRHNSHEAFLLLGRLGLGFIAVATLLAVLVYIIGREKRSVLQGLHRSSSIFNTKIANRLRFMAWSGIHGTKLMLSDKKAVRKYIGASCIMWLLYFVAVALMATAYFGNLRPPQTWYVVQSVFAGLSAPAGPGYIGTFHIIVTKLLSELKLPMVGGFSVLIWAVNLLPISFIGVFVLAKQRFSHKTATPQRDALINKLHREQDISAELGNFLDAYLKGEKINQILSHAELEGKFKLIKSFKGGSNAHTMLVWQDQELRVKKITLLQYADKLEEQAKWLIEREALANLPKVVTQEKTGQYYYFDLAYHEDFNPFFEFIHSHTADESYGVLERMLDFMNEHVYQDHPVHDGTAKLLQYIDGKVLGKVNDTAAMSPAISKLVTYKKLIINGQSYDNLPTVIERIKNHERAMADLSTYNESAIHGDLTVDNLIVSSEGDFLVIDPNNENQVSARVVDFGKLYQSLQAGYEFLIQLESCQVEGNRIHFEDAKSHKYAEIFRRFDKKLKQSLEPKDYRSILFHEAVHYCRMLTYRVTINPLTAPVFYATAVKLFNEFLDQYD